MELQEKLETVKASRSGIRRFLFLFSLPFVAVGVGTAYFFLSKVLGPEGFSPNLIPLLAFSLMFGGAGLFLMLKVPKMLDGAVHKLELKAEQEKSGAPFKPWLENADWKSGKIECSNQGGMIGIWIFAVIWSAFSFPAAYEPLMGIINDGQYAGAFILIFPVIGILLLYVAVWLTIRWRKFGRSFFEISNQTGYIGGELKGVVRTSVDIQATDSFTLKLKCLESITTGSGKSRSTTTHTRWEQEKKVPHGGVSSRMGLPVSFSIPNSCMETADASATGTVAWNLSIHAPVKGVDYSADFKVPVFKRREELLS